MSLITILIAASSITQEKSKTHVVLVAWDKGTTMNGKSKSLKASSILTRKDVAINFKKGDFVQGKGVSYIWDLWLGTILEPFVAEVNSYQCDDRLPRLKGDSKTISSLAMLGGPDDDSFQPGTTFALRKDFVSVSGIPFSTSKAITITTKDNSILGRLSHTKSPIWNLDPSLEEIEKRIIKQLNLPESAYPGALSQKTTNATLRSQGQKPFNLKLATASYLETKLGIPIDWDSKFAIILGQAPTLVNGVSSSAKASLQVTLSTCMLWHAFQDEGMTFEIYRLKKIVLNNTHKLPAWLVNDFRNKILPRFKVPAKK